MRQVVHVSYATLLGVLAARAGAPAQPTPDYAAFHAGLLDGSVDLVAAERKLQYANVHLAAARAAMSSPRFAEALAVLRAQSRA